MTIGIRLIKVSKKVDFGSSVVAQTMRTLAERLLPDSPNRLYIPVSIK